MPNMDRIYTALFAAVDRLNKELPSEQRLTKEPQTVVFGRGGRLDSLGLVNFLDLHGKYHDIRGEESKSCVFNAETQRARRKRREDTTGLRRCGGRGFRVFAGRIRPPVIRLEPTKT